MTREQFLNDIKDKMSDAILVSKKYDENVAAITYEIKCGYIDVIVDYLDETEIIIYQYNPTYREHPLLENEIKSVLPLWSDIEYQNPDYWDSNGFADELDYAHWKYCS